MDSDDTAFDDEDHAVAWRSRPWLARAARATIVGVPFLVVIVVAWQLNAALGRPATVLEAVARWGALSVFSTLALVGIDRSARQNLPLPSLLQLSIIFPDHAPSRFKMALRRGTAKHLAREVADLDDANAQEAAEYLLTVVGNLTAHDRLTRGHTERVRAYADLVAVEMGFTPTERMKLHWAGLLHDIGKLSVPTEILNKPGNLSDREWSRLKTHPNEGWKMVQPMRAWLGEWARATRDHHESWDGSGYPRGLRGPEISRAGRIISVVDAFDVMTTVRAYKTAISHEEARAELARCAGVQFDPDVVRAFLSASIAPQRQRGKIGTWIANAPVALQATSVIQVPAAVTSAVAAVIAATTIIAPVLSDEAPDEVAQRVVGPAPVTTIAPTTAPPTTARPTTSTTTTTTTTLAPPATSAAVVTTTPPSTTAPPATVAPTTTTTLAPPTTTTLAPSTFAGGYLGAGSGGSTFGLVSAVGGSGATDWDADADPGLTLTSGAAGLAEIDAAHVEAWSITVAEQTRLQGQASLRLFVAAPGFSADNLAGIRAGLVECVNATTNCSTIGAGSAVFSQESFGDDFGVVTINLGAIDHTLAAGHTLLVSMTVPQNVATDTWLAFGTSTYPSRFRLV